MNCRYCGAELEDGQKTCPQCGKKDTEVKVWKVVLITLGCVVLLAALTFAVLYACGVGFASAPDQESTEPSGTEESTHEPGSVESSLSTAVRGSYSGSDEDAAAAADQVVAVLGDRELTNAELQMFYWMTVYDFLDNYSYYLTSLGLDYTQPLDQQIMDADTGDTWQQYFLEKAIQTWQRYTVVDLLGEEAGHVMSQETQDALAKVPESLQELAEEGDFESVLAMIQADMGCGATEEGYLAYMRTTYSSLDYFSVLYETFQPTMEEIEAYFAENESVFASNGITKDSGNLVDVRHILIIPKGGTVEDNTTTYTDEEWAACLAEAEKIYDMWKNGDASEESFAELAATYSEDPGSVSNGGLYSNVSSGYMIQPFNDWIFDESREPGDTGIVQTDYGYHIMFFVKSEEKWVVQARSSVISEMSSEVIEEALSKWELKVDFGGIVLGVVDMSPATE